MKKFKITVFLTLALTLAGTGNVIAQDERRGVAREERTQVWAERMTERMAETYGLDEKQKKDLQEANEIFMQKMGDMPRMRDGRYYGHRHHRRRPSAGCCGEVYDDCCGCHHGHVRAGRHHFTEEERKAMADRWEKTAEDRKAAFQAYEASLQKIMTKDQYEAYKKKQAERWERMHDWRGNRR